MLDTPETSEAFIPGKGILQIPDKSGHTRIVWDPDDPGEVAKARSAFETALKSGYAAFRMNEDGTVGSQIRTFDGYEGRILMQPALRGG